MLDIDDEYGISESTTLDQSAVSSEATAAESGRSGERTDEDDMDLDMEDERDRSTETTDGVTSEGEKHLPANVVPVSSRAKFIYLSA